LLTNVEMAPACEPKFIQAFSSLSQGQTPKHDSWRLYKRLAQMHKHPGRQCASEIKQEAKPNPSTTE